MLKNGKLSSLARRSRAFLPDHPILAQALLWAIPAILLGGILRGILLSYSPYAYWGSDSWSYFSFAYKMLTTLDTSLNDKRRYLYPMFLLPMSMLPGSPLQWLAWIQHFAGLATLVPLAYAVRRLFVSWKLVIVPVTVLWAGLPIILWYEHELLAESLFFAAVVWSMGGWVAWTKQADPARARRLFGIFLAALACVVLTKPAARFVWPGVLAGLVMIGSWRVLRWRQFAALGLLLGASLTIGQDKQGAYLLYSSSFPLTRLNTAPHAEYKTEIRDLVTEYRAHLPRYHARDRAVKNFLKRPGDHPGRPLWAALEDDPEKRTELYQELALEGLLRRPDLLVLISLTRALDSANLAEFKTGRFEATYFAERFAEHDEEWRAENGGHLLKFLFDLPREAPVPPYSELRHRLAPHPQAPQAVWLRRYADGFAEAAALIKPVREEADALPHPTPLGWYLLAGSLLSFAPPYWRGLAPWSVVAAGYLAGVYLVGSANPRFFALVLPMLLLYLAVPVDLAARLLAGRKPRTAEPAGAASR